MSQSSRPPMPCCHTKSTILPQFSLIEPHFVRKRWAGPVKIAILPQFWRSNLVSCPRVVAAHSKSQFHFSFWRSKLVSCERVAAEVVKSQLSSFCRSNLISCETVATDTSKSQFHLSFWRSKLVSCERVAAEVVKSRFHFSFWRSNLVSAKGLRFLPSRWHCPAP